MKNLVHTCKVFTAAPHRVMFFGGALQVVAVMVWWLLDMAGRFGVAGHPIVWSILPNAAHIYLMVFGLFPSFIFGFVMTTFPRWMGGREISASYYVTTFILMLLGNVLFYTGLVTQQCVLLLAVYSTLAGWLGGRKLRSAARNTGHKTIQQAQPCRDTCRVEFGLVESMRVFKLAV